MADWWPTNLDGDPAACGALAAHLRQMAADVDAAARAVSQAVATPAWSGTASENAVLRVAATAASAHRLAKRMRNLAQGVADLGAVLGRVAADLGHARALALADGLTATAGGFRAPAHHPAAQAVAGARADEFRAHQALAGALRTVTEGPMVMRLLTSAVDGALHLPSPDDDLLGRTSWLVGLPSAADLLTEKAQARLSAIRVHGLSTALASENPHLVGAASLVTRAGPLATRAAAAAGPVGDVLTVVTASHGQWQADADDPRLSTTDRVGRSVVRGTLEGGTVVAGAIAVGEPMAALGTMICPGIGTVVLGGIGAAAGGFIASEAGRAAIDAAVEGVDEVIDLAGDAASAVADAASDAAGAVGDAAESVSGAAEAAVDKCCFWK